MEVSPPGGRKTSRKASSPGRKTSSPGRKASGPGRRPSVSALMSLLSPERSAKPVNIEGLNVEPRNNNSIDLQKMFPRNDVCLLSRSEKRSVWRLLDARPEKLNLLRRWLETSLVSVAIDWVYIEENGGTQSDELLSHRLGLVAIDADPLSVADFTGSNFDLCSEDTCILFDLDVRNRSSGVKDVLAGDLIWIPLGSQARRWKLRPPRPLDPSAVLTKLYPGQNLRLRCFAVRGTNSQHSKWGSVLPYFGMVPAKLGDDKSPVKATVSSAPLPPDETGERCSPCDQLGPAYRRGAECFHFTIELQGGLTFQDVDKQLSAFFKWPDLSAEKQ